MLLQEHPKELIFKEKSGILREYFIFSKDSKKTLHQINLCSHHNIQLTSFNWETVTHSLQLETFNEQR